MLENHGSEEVIVRELLYWASLPEACRLALPILGIFATRIPLQLPPARGASEGEQAFRYANGHMVIKPIHHHQRLAPASARRPATPPVVEVDTAMSPNYKKGGGDVACCAATGPERPGKDRDAGEAGAPLSGWPAPASCRRKQEEQKRKPAGISWGIITS